MINQTRLNGKAMLFENYHLTDLLNFILSILAIVRIIISSCIYKDIDFTYSEGEIFRWMKISMI